MRITKWPAAAVVAASLSLVAIGGIASASIPDGSGVIHACYQSPPPAHGANLQVIDTNSGGSCAGGAASLTWRSAPTGTLSAPYVVTNAATVPAGAGVTCNAGDQATGGGWTSSDGTLWTLQGITKDGPVLSAGQAVGWVVNTRNSDQNASHSLNVYVLCARVS